MKNKQPHTKACVLINDNSPKEVCFCPKREYIKEYEDLISDRTTKRGWSKINSAHDLLSDLVDYINTHYSDNGNKVVLKMEGFGK